MISFKIIFAISLSLFSFSVFAAAAGPQDCEDMNVWDYDMGMCMPRAMAGMPMSMLMLDGNAFLTQSYQAKPRGRDVLAAPNMIMADIGTSLGDRNYVNFDFMGTAEKWTTPRAGYPELLQIGEEQDNGQPFLDAQHPHSSPVMGVTFSDTISIGNDKDHAKIWFSPRGQSTDGPVAFMHRPTGMVNPDAPLGHHIGQDVGHITSSVYGASLSLGETTFEASTFYGQEPEPTKVDLPMATPNSYAARLIEQWNENSYAMLSAAYVKKPEPHDDDLDHVWRYSASLYNKVELAPKWTWYNTLVWGLINNYDRASALNSFLEEFWVNHNNSNFWGRLEYLQRTPDELEIATDHDPIKGQWVTALTLGYTHDVMKWESLNLGVGGSLTVDLLPHDYQQAYTDDPVSGRVFVQLSGMKMWDL